MSSSQRTGTKKGNYAIQWKPNLIVLAGVNVSIFHGRTYRGVAAWDMGRPALVAARVAAVVSVTSWSGVTVAGGLRAYT